MIWKNSSEDFRDTEIVSLFQKNQRRLYNCKALQFSNTQQIMPDPEAAFSLSDECPSLCDPSQLSQDLVSQTAVV
jgi:hypothetical protein